MATERIQLFLDNRGGINVQDNPLLLNNNESLLVQNYILDNIGTMLKRPGYKSLNLKPIRENDAIQEVISVHQHIDKSGNALVFACAGTKIYKYSSESFAFEAVSGGDGLTSGLRYSIVSWINGTQDFVIFTNGTDAIKKYDVSTGVITDLSTDSAVPTGNILTVWKNYLWVASTGDPVIHYSKLDDATTWLAANINNTQSEYNFGVTGLLGMSFGMYVFHRDSTEILVELISSLGFGVRPLDSVDYGCIAPFSLRRVPDGCMFLSEKGIARLTGTKAEIVSENINSIIDKIDATDNKNCVSINYKGRTYPRNHYFLSVPLVGGENISPGKNNTTLVYFYDNDAWHLFRGMNANCYALGEDTNDREILYFGDKSGNVHQYDALGATSDNDTIIETEWIKVLNLGAIENYKQAVRMLILYQAKNDVTINLRLQGIKDDFDWTAITRSVTLSAEGSTSKSVYSGLTNNYPFLNNQVFKIKEFGVDFQGRLLLVRMTNTEIARDYRIVGIGIVYSVMEEVNS